MFKIVVMFLFVKLNGSVKMKTFDLAGNVIQSGQCAQVHVCGCVHLSLQLILEQSFYCCKSVKKWFDRIKSSGIQ